MMVAITALKQDDLLYEVVSQKAGNTTMRRKAVYAIRITEVAADFSYVMARWNSNPPRKFGASQVAKWRRTKPAR